MINKFKLKYGHHIKLGKIDVTNKNSILSGFEKMGKQYDCIIEDTTHQFEDQIRVIENCHEYLKDGGLLIIEDIPKKNKESDYIKRL